MSTLALAGAAGLAASAAGIVHGVFTPQSGLLMPVVARLPRSAGPAAALTFDDGPHPVGTPAVLEVLAARNVSATFFVIGRQAERHPELLRAVRDAGHAIGNHSFRHGHADAFRSAGWWRDELRRCNDAVGAATGEAPTLFRPPMGIKSPRMGVAVRDLRLTTVTWTRRAKDGHRAEPERILRRLGGAGPGEILTLHDGVDPRFDRDPRPTAAALGPLIDRLLAGGRIERFVTLVTLGALDAVGTRGPSPNPEENADGPRISPGGSGG